MKHLLCVLLLVVCCYAGDPKTYGDVLVDGITSIYDGDTFRCTIKDYPPIIGERIGVRVYGIDTPELRDKCEEVKEKARAAKQFTVSMLRSAKKIELRNLRRDKYFRILAEVYVDGKSLAQELIKAGHAKPYDGGTKADWAAESGCK